MFCTENLGKGVKVRGGGVAGRLVQARCPCDKNNKLSTNKIDEPIVFYIFGLS